MPKIMNDSKTLDMNNMLKCDILDRVNFRCVHRHDGFSHKRCFEKARAQGERIGFLDIESGGSLDADWGFLLTYCIKKLDGPIIEGQIRPSEVRKAVSTGGTKDKRLLEKFCKDVWQFDTLVVYYGRDKGGRYQRHDIPFLRTRAAKWNVKGFPMWKQMKVIDLYDIVSAKFKLSRKSMQNACRLFGIESKASPFNMEVWQDALAGHQEALNYILEHNREDVISTEKLFKVLMPYKGTRGKI